MQNTLIKVCCISTVKEASLALDVGADLLGFVSEMPSGPGVISLQSIGNIIDSLPSDTKSVLLTSKLTASDIIVQHQQVSSWGIQLVDFVPKKELLVALARLMIGKSVVRSVKKAPCLFCSQEG